MDPRVLYQQGQGPNLGPTRLDPDPDFQPQDFGVTKLGPLCSCACFYIIYIPNYLRSNTLGPKCIVSTDSGSNLLLTVTRMHQSMWRPRKGRGANPGDSDRAKYHCQKSLRRAKISCQIPGGQKRYDLAFLFKLSEFTLGGGRKHHQKSPLRGKMSYHMPQGIDRCKKDIALFRRLDGCTSMFVIWFIK